MADRPTDVVLARVLKGEASPDEHAAVRGWREAIPDNEVEYRALARVAELAARLPELIEAPARPSAAQLIGTRRRVLRPAVAWFSAAAAVVAFLGASWYLSHNRGTPRFGVQEVVTSASETTTLELDDGTVVRIAPSSRLRVLAKPGRREVALEGRGFFAVAHQNGTPFLIHTAAGDVTVLGTRLDLEAHARDLRLVVVQGRVALSTERGQAELTAGEMGSVRNGEAAPVVKVPDVEAFVEWTGRFLAFQSTPLGDAAREVERVYSVRVEITDAQLAQRVITAWFWDRSLGEVVDVVCLAVAARCTIKDGVVRMLPDVHGGGR